MGRLVVIEGLDGAGKRTLADRLAAALDGRVAPVRVPPLRRRRARRARPRRALRPHGRPRRVGARDGGAVRAGPPRRRPGLRAALAAPRRRARRPLRRLQRRLRRGPAARGRGGRVRGVGPRAGDRALRHPRARPPAPPGRAAEVAAASAAAHRERTEDRRAATPTRPTTACRSAPREVYARARRGGAGWPRGRCSTTPPDLDRPISVSRARGRSLTSGCYAADPRCQAAVPELGRMG